MKFTIRKLKPKDVSKLYIQTVNNKYTKKFIEYSKKGKKKKNRQDLINYINSLSKNEFLFGIFMNNIHAANFKISIIKNKLYIGFLVFLRFQGKGIIYKVFPKILKLKVLKSKKLYLGVDINNKRAISLYKKLGFIYIKNSKKLMFIKLNYKKN